MRRIVSVYSLIVDLHCIRIRRSFFMNNIVVSGSNLTIEDVINAARNNYKVELS